MATYHLARINFLHEVPVLIVIPYRGDIGDPRWMGLYKKTTEPGLNAMDIPYRIVSRSQDIVRTIKDCNESARAWLKPRRRAAERGGFMVTRLTLLKELAAIVPDEVLVLTSIGNNSGFWGQLKDREANLFHLTHGHVLFHGARARHWRCPSAKSSRSIPTAI